MDWFQINCKGSRRVGKTKDTEEWLQERGKKKVWLSKSAEMGGPEAQALQENRSQGRATLGESAEDQIWTEDIVTFLNHK